MLCVQRPRLFRVLVSFNGKLPRAFRFVRNPVVELL
jgi:hypothetical protein